MSGSFNFQRGNLQKLLSLPAYALGALLAVFVPRARHMWVFGSGLGFGEGALAVSRALKQTDSAARIRWLVTSDEDIAAARALGMVALRKASLAGFWATLRARQIVVTHGAGDVNRFAVFGATLVNLYHGAPLKKLHFDSPVTTAVRGPAPLRALLRRMYRVGAGQVSLFVVGSVTAAERLRSAYRVDPGRVAVLGDARDDVVCQQAEDAGLASEARARVVSLLGLSDAELDASSPLVLYAPTWRDGDPDPAIPTADEMVAMRDALDALGAHLVIRSHPLGAGAYDAVLGERVHLLGADRVREITPLLGAFDAVVTDYSSIALDFALLGRPIVWFAPDLAHYSATRGLYEPLEVTAAAQVQRNWAETLARLSAVLEPGAARTVAQRDARALSARFHAHPEGGAAVRVVHEIQRLARPTRERIAPNAVFFESFYGKQVSCNPLAIDREIARRLPDTPRYWSVTSERIAVPEGATPVLVGGADWHAARREADLLVVNDWLRYRFRRRRGQTVLQTWHGTMLKHLALGRPNVSLRTRLAIRRESRRWSLMLSQNPHSTAQFRASYAFDGEVLELGYPRDDRLAASVAGGARITIAMQGARRALGVPAGRRVLAYVPTWREGGGHVDMLDTAALARELGDAWVVVARGHTRSGGAYLAANGGVIDASTHPDVNDVILAADLLVTDYSSIMFDAAVARVPMAFFVPDLAAYRDRERGFTFDFEGLAPGPLLTTRAEVVAAAHDGVPLSAAYTAWCERFTPLDDGRAADRVIDALIDRGVL